jgi:hypothetical protein
VKLKRETVQKFWCPACGAAPRQLCVIEGTGEPRAKLHAARVDKAERIISATLRERGKTRDDG